jgi:hypothetical protein
MLVLRSAWTAAADLQSAPQLGRAQWSAAERRLVARGWLDDAGAVTDRGRRVRAVERATDARAAAPWQALGEEHTSRLAALLTRSRPTCVASPQPDRATPLG